MLVQQPVGMVGVEMDAPEARGRSRRGRTIKPKRRLDDEEDANTLNRASLRAAGKSDTAGICSIEDCCPDLNKSRSVDFRYGNADFTELPCEGVRRSSHLSN